METSKSSTRQLTLDELIYSLEGSPANPTPSQESERERRTSATCGQRCCALFENAPRATSWAKTFAALLIGTGDWFSKRCALTWKLKGTPYNRSYFQLVASAHHTDGIGFGLLPTPTTDSASDRTKNYAQGGTPLPVAVRALLPTPTAYDWNTARSPEALQKAKEKYGSALQDSLRQRAGQGFQLSPLFVAEMMGFPKNWTELPFQSGDEKA